MFGLIVASVMDHHTTQREPASERSELAGELAGRAGMGVLADGELVEDKLLLTRLMRAMRVMAAMAAMRCRRR